MKSARSARRAALGALLLALPGAASAQSAEVVGPPGGEPSIVAPPPAAHRPPPPGPPAPEDMVSFPAGPFVMGCAGELPICDDDREPVRTITLSAFAIERRPVTQRQYAACIEAGACRTPAEWAFFRPTERGERPVVGVTWAQAEGYCAWMGRRLPTEAEWARAARGTAGRLYPGGDSAYAGGATPEGVVDLIGSVKQWVADWYTVDGYARLAERDPTGDPTGTRKALRGLESLFGRGVPATFRADRHPEVTDTGISMRCALSLGPRTPTPSVQPPSATDGPPWAVVDVAVGEGHTCAVDAAGRGFCWGDDRFRQLAPSTGQRPRADSLRPRLIEGFVFDAVEAGPLGTCGRAPDGWMRCWGELRAVAAVADFAVGGRVCAVFGPARTPPPMELAFDGRGATPMTGPPGALACDEGKDAPMRLMTDAAGAPVEPRDPASLAVGHRHACAVDAVGRPWCWGDNGTFQLGVNGGDDSGVMGDDEVHVLPVEAGFGALAHFTLPPLLERMGPVAEVAVGSHHTCARHRSGAVSCWGRGTYGALGWPADRSHPDLQRDRTLGPLRWALALPVMGIDDARMLVDGQDHTCAVRADGSLWCWGDNKGGQLGDGTIDSRATAAPVKGLPGPVIAADGGRQHACAVVGRSLADAQGELYCWGSNEYGQLGDGTRIDRRLPVRIRPAP